MSRSLKPPVSSKALPWASIWLLSMYDVLPSAAGGLGHLVVLAALRIVEFCIRLPVVEGQEAAAELQSLKLHYRRQRECVKPAEPSVFVEQLWHGRFGKKDGSRAARPHCQYGQSGQ